MLNFCLKQFRSLFLLHFLLLLSFTAVFPSTLMAKEAVLQSDSAYETLSKEELENKIISLDGRIKQVPCSRPRELMQGLIEIGDHYRALVKKRDNLYSGELEKQFEGLKQFLVINDPKNNLVPGKFAAAYYELLKKGTALGVFRDPATLTGDLPKGFREAGVGLPKIATHGRQWINLEMSGQEAQEASEWMDKVFFKEGQTQDQSVESINNAYDKIDQGWGKARTEYIKMLSTDISDAQALATELAEKLTEMVKDYEEKRTEIRSIADERDEAGEYLYEHCIGELTIPTSWVSVEQDYNQLEWLDKRARLFYEPGAEGTTEALPGMGYRFLSPTEYRWDKPELRAKDAAAAKKQIAIEFPLHLPEFKLNQNKYMNHYSSVLEARERFEAEANRAVGQEIALLASKWMGIVDQNATGKDLTQSISAILGDDLTSSLFQGMGLTNYTLYTMGSSTQKFAMNTVLKPIGETLNGVQYVLTGDIDGLTMSDRLQALGIIIGGNAKKLPETVSDIGKFALEKSMQVIGNTTKAIAYSARKAGTDCSKLTGRALIQCRESRLEASREVRKASTQLTEDVTQLSLMVLASKINTPLDDAAQAIAEKLYKSRVKIGKYIKAAKQKKAAKKAMELAEKLKKLDVDNAKQINKFQEDLTNNLNKVDDLEKKIARNKTSTDSDWDQKNRGDLTDESRWVDQSDKNSGGFNQYQKKGEYGYKRSKDAVEYAPDNLKIKGQLADEYGSKLIGDLDSHHVGNAKVHDQFVEIKTTAHQVKYIDVDGNVKTARLATKDGVAKVIDKLEETGHVVLDSSEIIKTQTFKTMDEGLAAAKKLKETGWNSTVRKYQVVENIPENLHGTRLKTDYDKIKQFDDPDIPANKKISRAEYDELKKSVKERFEADERAARIMDKNNIIHLDDTWSNKAYKPKDGGGYKVAYIDSGGTFKINKALPGCDLEQTTHIFRKSLRDAWGGMDPTLSKFSQYLVATKKYKASVNKYLKKLNGNSVPDNVELGDMYKYTDAKKLGYILDNDLPMFLGDNYLPNTEFTKMSGPGFEKINSNVYERKLIKSKESVKKSITDIENAAQKTSGKDPSITLKKKKPAPVTTTQQKKMSANLLLIFNKKRCMGVKKRYLAGETNANLKTQYIECQKFLKEN